MKTQQEQLIQYITDTSIRFNNQTCKQTFQSLPKIYGNRRYLQKKMKQVSKHSSLARYPQQNKNRVQNSYQSQHQMHQNKVSYLLQNRKSKNLTDMYQINMPMHYSNIHTPKNNHLESIKIQLNHFNSAKKQLLQGRQNKFNINRLKTDIGKERDDDSPDDSESLHKVIQHKNNRSMNIKTQISHEKKQITQLQQLLVNYHNKIKTNMAHLQMKRFQSENSGDNNNPDPKSIQMSLPHSKGDQSGEESHAFKEDYKIDMSTINREQKDANAGGGKNSFTEESDTESFLEVKKKNIRQKFNPTENIEEEDQCEMLEKHEETKNRKLDKHKKISSRTTGRKPLGTEQRYTKPVKREDMGKVKEKKKFSKRRKEAGEQQILKKYSGKNNEFLDRKKSSVQKQQLKLSNLVQEKLGQPIRESLNSNQSKFLSTEDLQETKFWIIMKKQDELKKKNFNSSKISRASSSSHLHQCFKIPDESQYEAFITNYKSMYAEKGHISILKEMLTLKNFRILKQDDGVYFGLVNENNEKHGNGVKITEKIIYQGKYFENAQVEGIERNMEGFYTGKFKNGLRDNFGTFQWHNGEKFQGFWKNGLKNGHGKWKAPQGHYYEGEWIDNRQEGKGMFRHRISTYRGTFVNFLKQGEGEQIFTNGDVYKGQYIAGKPSGYGVYTWKKGGSYQGNFEGGLREGYGKWIQKDNSIYEGNFKKDIKHGYGKQIYPDGDIFEGEFRNGTKYKGILKRKDGYEQQLQPQ